MRRRVAVLVLTALLATLFGVWLATRYSSSSFDACTIVLANEHPLRETGRVVIGDAFLGLVVLDSAGSQPFVLQAAPSGDIPYLGAELVDPACARKVIGSVTLSPSAGVVCDPGATAPLARYSFHILAPSGEEVAKGYFHAEEVELDALLFTIRNSCGRGEFLDWAVSGSTETRPIPPEGLREAWMVERRFFSTQVDEHGEPAWRLLPSGTEAPEVFQPSGVEPSILAIRVP